MPRYARVLFVVLMLASCGPVEDYSQDIINPVPGYRQIKRTSEDQPRDSIKTCEAFFETLPRFGEPASVVFTYYSQFDSEAGLEIAMQSETFTLIKRNPSIVTIPGPVARGDTIQCRFQIIPRAVGGLDLSFIVYDPTNKLVRTPVRVGAHVYARMLLSPAGETIALATPACSVKFGPLLGSYPELLRKGALFSLYPIPPLDLQSPDHQEYLTEVAYVYVYDVRLKVTPGYETGSVIVHGTVSPYHSLDAGVAFRLKHSDNLNVTSMSPGIAGPVLRGESYDFEIETKATRPSEIGVLRIGFVTPNPDFGSSNGVFSALQKELLERTIKLYVGFDESGNLSFVTDKNVWALLESREKEGIKPKFVDERLELVRTHKRPRTQGDVIYSENYDKITNAYKAER